MKRKINIFLDDERMPDDIKSLIGNYYVEEWIIIRNYNDFVQIVNNHLTEINLVSFDHDIACFEDNVEKTGKNCADYLINKCIEENIKFPNWFIHTQNTVGRENLKSSILTYLKYFEDKIPVFKYHSSGIINNNII